MEQQSNSVRPQTDGPNPQADRLCALLDGVEFQMDIGLDGNGCSHFHAVDDDIVIVCEGDRRGRGIRDQDIEETHVIVGDKTVEDWVTFVQDRRGWQDVRDDLKQRVFGPGGIPGNDGE